MGGAAAGDAYVRFCSPPCQGTCVPPLLPDGSVCAWQVCCGRQALERTVLFSQPSPINWMCSFKKFVGQGACWRQRAQLLGGLHSSWKWKLQLR